eukprot:CAMPEP_0173418942 /NCGR_PEP_ID=MMETSP1357-20121228/946_1 /TAXON_ID=77926 /ORGANISM="Hemiselmis rufescens, Strain PCC563" /LENGTH=137 /DNA_ID=CAMNT_0014381495 /DNA_START=33 /DNA_END=446 /DNA_ORIENTATION=+
MVRISGAALSGIVALLCLADAGAFLPPPLAVAGGHVHLSQQRRVSGTPKGAAPLQRRTPGTALSMKEGGDGGGDGGEKGAWERLKDSFKEGVDEDGKTTISEAEKNMSYAVDLVTLTAGAAVFTCLFLNLMGKVPCI